MAYIASEILLLAQDCFIPV
jgi:hypothetical protein